MRKRLFEILDISQGRDKISSVYDYSMMVAIILSIIPLGFKATNPIFTAIEFVTVAMFIGDYLARLGTADYKFPSLGIKAFFVYPFTPYAIIDLLSILPVLTTLNSGLKLLRLFRLNRVWRVFKVLRYSKSFSRILDVVKRERRALMAVGYLSIGYILVSALLMFSVEPETYDTFFDALYWSVGTLTTVGYGDSYPASVIGKIISMISSFLGIALVALPTGIITAGYMRALDKSKHE